MDSINTKSVNKNQDESRVLFLQFKVPRFSIAVKNDVTWGMKYNNYKGASARAK